jgi:hypothetical protein
MFFLRNEAPIFETPLEPRRLMNHGFIKHERDPLTFRGLAFSGCLSKGQERNE